MPPQKTRKNPAMGESSRSTRIFRRRITYNSTSEEADNERAEDHLQRPVVREVPDHETGNDTCEDRTIKRNMRLHSIWRNQRATRKAL